MPRMGKVVFSTGDASVQCTVRDFSPSGAVVTMSGWLGLPSGFTLYVEPDGVRAECRIIRRKGNNIEVEFLSLDDNARYRSAASEADSRSC